MPPSLPDSVSVALQLNNDPLDQTIFFYRSNGTLSGGSFLGATDVFRITWEFNNDNVEQVVVYFTPEVRQDQSGVTFKATPQGVAPVPVYEGRVFKELACRLVVSPGGYIVLGPGADVSHVGLLGREFLVSPIDGDPLRDDPCDRAAGAGHEQTAPRGGNQGGDTSQMTSEPLDIHVFRETLEESTVAVMLVDRDLKLTFVNRVARDLFDLPGGLLAGAVDPGTGSGEPSRPAPSPVQARPVVRSRAQVVSEPPPAQPLAGQGGCASQTTAQPGRRDHGRGGVDPAGQSPGCPGPRAAAIGGNDRPAGAVGSCSAPFQQPPGRHVDQHRLCRGQQRFHRAPSGPWSGLGPQLAGPAS